MSATRSSPVPLPRTGVRGAWDRFVGPGASAWENAGTLGLAAVGALVAPALVRQQRPAASPLELAAAAAVGLDVAGGAWCNETPSAKRWYHRAGRRGVGRVAFAALHLYPFVVESTSGRRRWRNAVMSYASLVASAAALELVPTERRRSVASGLYTTWLAGTSIVAPAPNGYAWLPPLLGFKLLLGHGTPRGPRARLGGRRQAGRG